MREETHQRLLFQFRLPFPFPFPFRFPLRIGFGWRFTLLLFTSHLVQAAPMIPGFLKAPMIEELENEKVFTTSYDETVRPMRRNTVILIVRQVEDPLRKESVTYTPVGRAVAIDGSKSGARLVRYKIFNSLQIQKGDRLLHTGDPLSKEEMDLIRDTLLGVLQQDKEIEDYFSGLISVKVGLYSGSLSSTSTVNGAASDTNAFKSASGVASTNFGLRWWPKFSPRTGLNIEYSSGPMPTVGFRRQAETSTQTYLNPGFMYRGRFLLVPAIYSVNYTINTFKTTNTDDFLISSTYSSVNLGLSFFLPFPIRLLGKGSTAFSLNNFEGGVGFSPIVLVNDELFKRGTASGRMISYNLGIEFNLKIKKLGFLDNLFFILEWGQQNYFLDFSGPTTGNLPDGSPIPENNKNAESQTWYGLRIKYNLPDYIGEIFDDS